MLVVTFGKSHFFCRTKSHIYDAASDSWTAVADANVGKQGTSVISVGGRIFALGGWSVASTDSDTVEEYNPKTNTWSENFIFNNIIKGVLKVFYNLKTACSKKAKSKFFGWEAVSRTASKVKSSKNHHPNQYNEKLLLSGNEFRDFKYWFLFLTSNDKARFQQLLKFLLLLGLSLFQYSNLGLRPQPILVLFSL